MSQSRPPKGHAVHPFWSVMVEGSSFLPGGHMKTSDKHVVLGDGIYQDIWKQKPQVDGGLLIFLVLRSYLIC